MRFLYSPHAESQYNELCEVHKSTYEEDIIFIGKKGEKI